MSHIEPTYVLYIDCPVNGMEEILTTKDPFHLRHIATGRRFTKRLQRNLGCKALITKDGKTLRGGANALDDICYQHWLQEHQENDK